MKQAKTISRQEAKIYLDGLLTRNNWSATADGTFTESVKHMLIGLLNKRKIKEHFDAIAQDALKRYNNERPF